MDADKFVPQQTSKRYKLQAQAAYEAGDLSLLIQCLQELIIGENFKDPEIVKNQEYFLELALFVLEVGDFQQRWDIAKIFNRLGAIAISPLIEILEDEEAEEELRFFVVRILGDFKDQSAIEPLVRLLKTSDSEELREIAGTVLGEIGPTAIAALTSLLATENTRFLAVRSLSCIRCQEIITPLLSVVQDLDVGVRTAAIEALSSFHDERIPPVLLNALDDVAATVRIYAVQGLGLRSNLRDKLDLTNRLQPRLYDFNLDVCCAAAAAISRMGDDAAAGHLFQVLISPHTPMKLQIEVIRALSWLGTLSSLTYLRQAFEELSTPTLWQEIVTVLGRVQQPDLKSPAAEILLEILKIKHPALEIASVKSAIALSLGQLGNPQAIEPLTALLADTDAPVRLHAIAALKNLAQG
jgi:HEAT repeat protein